MPNGNTVRVTISTASLELIEQTREVNELPGEYVERAIRTEAYIRSVNTSIVSVKELLEHLNQIEPGSLSHDTVSSAIDAVSRERTVSEQYKDMTREQLRRQAHPGPVRLHGWYCEQCDFRTTNESLALSHSDAFKHSLAHNPYASELPATDDTQVYSPFEETGEESPGTDSARARRIQGALIEDGDEDD